MIHDIRNISIIGCGTASYASLAGSILLNKITKRPVTWTIASEYDDEVEFLSTKSLVIALSQSDRKSVV